MVKKKATPKTTPKIKVKAIPKIEETVAKKQSDQSSNQTNQSGA